MPRVLHVHFKAKHNVGDAAVVEAVRQLAGSALGRRVTWTSMLVSRLREPASDRLLRFIDSHDLVIIGGGGFVSKHALPLNDELIAKIRAPIVLYGIGHNRHFGDPELGREQQASLALLARKATLVGVRDSATLRMLASLGAQPLLTGDPALFLCPRKPWRVPPRLSPAIGINLACHGWGQQKALLDHVLALYADVLRRLAASHAPQVLYMVHTDTEVPVALSLRREFPSLRICRYPAAKLLYVYGRLDLALSMMLHSSLLACAAGTPVVNVAYDEKNLAFMEDIGHTDRCFPVSSARTDAVHRACDAILDGCSREPGLARRTYGAAMDEFVSQLAALA